MVKLDIDTLELFRGVVDDNNCLVFEGEEKYTYFRLDSHHSHSQSSRFYQIVNPSDSTIINNIYVFNLLNDAVVFYSSQLKSLFENALIVILNEATKKEVAEKLLMIFTENRTYPKLHFYHQPEKADLFLFYLDLLKINLYYNIIYISKDLYLNIQYNSVSLTLSFRELKRLRFFLGVNDTKFKIKNNVLTARSMNEIISW